MSIEYRKHALKRLNERVGIEKNIINRIVNREDYIPIGYDLNKKNVKHLLIYVIKKKEYYVICYDEQTEEIITILFGLEFQNWNIDLVSFKKAKCLAYERALNNGTLNTIEKEIFNYSPEILEMFPLISKKLPKKIKRKKKSKSKEKSLKQQQNYNVNSVRLGMSKRLSELRRENIEKLKKAN